MWDQVQRSVQRSVVLVFGLVGGQRGRAGLDLVPAEQALVDQDRLEGSEPALVVVRRRVVLRAAAKLGLQPAGAKLGLQARAELVPGVTALLGRS